MLSSKSLSPMSRSLKVAIFFFFLSLYMVSRPAEIGSVDGLTMFWVCQSLVDDGDTDILNQSFHYAREQEKDEPWATRWICRNTSYGLIPSIVSVPFYIAGKWGSWLIGRPLNIRELFNFTSLSGAVITALACLVLFQFALALGFSARTAVLTAASFGLGTIAWLNAFCIATEPITTLATLSAVYAAYLYKIRDRLVWLYLSGFFSGVAASSREVSVIIAPPLLIYLLAVEWHKAKATPWPSRLRGVLRPLCLFLLGLLPFLALNIWYNIARFGLIYNVTYLDYSGKLSNVFSNPLFVGLFGLLLSPGKSLFLYCPILVLTLFSVQSFYAKHRAEFILIIFIFLSHLIVYAKCLYWEGGTAFGPRYLLPTVPLLVLLAASFWERLPERSFLTKIIVLGLFGFSVMIQTTPFWVGASADWVKVVEAGEKLGPAGNDLGEFVPTAYPLLGTPYNPQNTIAQLLFVPKHIRSLRLPILVLLLGTFFGSGLYLIKKVNLLPGSTGLRVFAVWMAVQTRTLLRKIFSHRKIAASVGIGLLALILMVYASYSYILIPLSRLNFKPFGNIEYPDNYGPDLTGKIETHGWVLDRSGVRAVAVYIDDVKVADAQYGEPTEHVKEWYPYIANSAYAGYKATDIDISRFSDGPHTLLIKALTSKGAWSDVSVVSVYLVNESPYDFWAHIRDARLSQADVIEETEISVNQESRRVLLQWISSAMTFERIPVYEHARLKFGMGINRRSEPEDDGDLMIEVLANSKESLWSMSVNPKMYDTQPQWYEPQIDLQAFQNQVISLTFTVKTQSGQDITSSQVGWSDLKIVYPDGRENSKE